MRSRAGRYVWHVQAIETTSLDRGCERDGRTPRQGVRGWQSLKRRDRVPQGAETIRQAQSSLLAQLRVVTVAHKSLMGLAHFKLQSGRFRRAEPPFVRSSSDFATLRYKVGTIRVLSFRSRPLTIRHVGEQVNHSCCVTTLCLTATGFQQQRIQVSTSNRHGALSIHPSSDTLRMSHGPLAGNQFLLLSHRLVKRLWDGSFSGRKLIDLS